MSWRWWISRDCLLHPTTLWLMMLFYVPGTIYGYIWYDNQLRRTWVEHPHWQLPFVPDSPTASLLFAVALVWLWIAPRPSRSGLVRAIRGIVEALGVVTSVKYGLWATIVIFAGYAQGETSQWTDWMLIVGHTAMAIVALLYARFFFFGGAALTVAAAWTLLNDAVDYRYGVFPYLPGSLYDDLAGVETFTYVLTVCSVAASAVARRLNGRRKPGVPNGAF